MDKSSTCSVTLSYAAVAGRKIKVAKDLKVNNRRQLTDCDGSIN